MKGDQTMNDEIHKTNPDQSVDSIDLALREIRRKYETIPFRERIRRMLEGLARPHDSGEYKWVRLELQRLSGPAIAILACLLTVAVLLLLPNDTEIKPRVIPVEVIEMEDPPEIEPEPPPPPPDVAPTLNDADFDGPAGDPTPIDVPTPTLEEPVVSAKPAEMNTVAQIHSPIRFKGLMASRSPGARGAALGKYGAGGGDATVYKALRWLKTQQNPDGSWGTDGNHYTAMTGLAILTYLAHGETPAPDTEFGPTVERAIRYLCQNQNEAGYFKAKDGNNYSHPIATYALGEAYAMTKNPLVKEAAEKAVVPIIKGQNAKNGWEYGLRVTDRSDTSYAGWCAQALKAVHAAGCEAPGLDECYEKAKKAFLSTYRGADGGFSYDTAGPNGHIGLSGVGALCMQLLGEFDAPEVKNTMRFLEGCDFSFENWDRNQPWNAGNSPSPIYYWYYITQAKFQEGGATFAAWNKKFFPELTKRQTVVAADASGYVDPEGRPRDIGYWDSPSAAESFHESGQGALPCTHWKDGVAKESVTTLNRRLMDTCLCSLQMMVYYRFLPTSQMVNTANAAPEPAPGPAFRREKDVAVRKQKKSVR